jgi:hypothetical protein
MLAQKLFRPPALDPLGPFVPADHPTLGIEHEDGVVGHRVDQ